MVYPVIFNCSSTLITYVTDAGRNQILCTPHPK